VFVRACITRKQEIIDIWHNRHVTRLPGKRASLSETTASDTITNNNFNGGIVVCNTYNGLKLNVRTKDGRQELYKVTGKHLYFGGPKAISNIWIGQL